MPRVAGVDIPAGKRLWISLQYVYGIGDTTARKICERAGVDSFRKTSELTDEELARINAAIDRDFLVEGGLRRQVQQNIQRLIHISSYRGLRHRRGLPVRGQRTRTNARTRKGPRKTVAGKKGVKEMHRG
jgi:small subunit ribosomal protein S13